MRLPPKRTEFSFSRRIPNFFLPKLFISLSSIAFLNTIAFCSFLILNSALRTEGKNAHLII